MFTDMKFNCHIYWNDEPGTIIIQVNATDEDSGEDGNISYSISKGNERV